MTDRELKRLSRAELLEMLLMQTKEVDRLNEELAQARAQLEERRVILKNAGDIANATLGLNKLFQAAQQTAEEYLENIRQLELQTLEKCQRMEQQTRETCDGMLRSARDEARSFWTKLQYEVRDYSHWKKISDIIEGKDSESRLGEADEKENN